MPAAPLGRQPKDIPQPTPRQAPATPNWAPPRDYGPTWRDEELPPGNTRYDDGVVYVADAGGRLTALDALTGARRWFVDPPGGERLPAAPMVRSGTVFLLAGEADGRRWMRPRRAALVVRDGPARVGVAEGHR